MDPWGPFGGKASLDHTRNSCMANVGNSTDCTGSSSCLAKVRDKNKNNQSSPDSLGTYPTWIVTQVDWYQRYWSFENSNNYQPKMSPGWKFTDQSQSSWDPTNRDTKKGPLSSFGPQQAVPSISLWVRLLSERFELWSLKLSTLVGPGLNYRLPSLLEAWP